MIEDLVAKSRSVRRFCQDGPVSTETLRQLVDLARYSPSGANLQPLKFILSNTPERNADIFATLVWAGYLKDWDGPAQSERPTAYIIILHDKQINKNQGCDHGIAAQSIMLGVCEKGIAGCMVGSIDRKQLRRKLAIANQYDISLVLALGKADEIIVLEDAKEDGSIEYYRDKNDIHHVPKRKLTDLILDI